MEHENINATWGKGDVLMLKASKRERKERMIPF